MLYEFIDVNRDEIIGRCRAKVAARTVPPPTDLEIDHGVPIEDGVAIQADRGVLASALLNVLQNAFKFTRPHTTVTLRVVANLERVLIEVEDECGGLPSGEADGLFRAFEQRSADRTGLGLGLAFSRWAVEASSGRISARSLPGRGCVFTIDMPRLPVAAVAGV